MAAPHDVPTAAQLVESVREWIERDVAPNVQGRLAFHSRVAANVLAMVERELASGGTDAELHSSAMKALGAVDDSDLAARIRNGSLDGELARVLEALEPVVRSKVAVANPKYLD